jgi:hypothetical protein
VASTAKQHDAQQESGGAAGSVAGIAWPALGMLMVASVGSIAQLSDSATFGWGAVTVYLIPAVMFLIPVGLVSAELATSNRGGIFVWVRDAYGDRSGFQATWFVFMNSVTLYPALLSFGAAALATALGRPDLASNGLYMGAVVLVVFWLATAIVTRGMEASTGMSNIGLGLGTILPAAALIAFMFAWLVDAKPNQIPWDGIGGLPRRSPGCRASRSSWARSSPSPAWSSTRCTSTICVASRPIT